MKVPQIQNTENLDKPSEAGIRKLQNAKVPDKY